ncbi:hypothetical protein A2U01_0073331, partial [Trifolium medium]|nr:hypothetical protein [Trifolium medium]
KPQTMKFNGNLNTKPEIGYHVTMKHDNKHRQSMTKGTTSLCQSDGARRNSVDTGGILTVGRKVELESLDLM